MSERTRLVDALAYAAARSASLGPFLSAKTAFGRPRFHRRRAASHRKFAASVPKIRKSCTHDDLYVAKRQSVTQPGRHGGFSTAACARLLRGLRIKPAPCTIGFCDYYAAYVVIEGPTLSVLGALRPVLPRLAAHLGWLSQSAHSLLPTGVVAAATTPVHAAGHFPDGLCGSCCVEAPRPLHGGGGSCSLRIWVDTGRAAAAVLRAASASTLAILGGPTAVSTSRRFSIVGPTTEVLAACRRAWKLTVATPDNASSASSEPYAALERMESGLVRVSWSRLELHPVASEHPQPLSKRCKRQFRMGCTAARVAAGLLHVPAHQAHDAVAQLACGPKRGPRLAMRAGELCPVLLRAVQDRAGWASGSALSRWGVAPGLKLRHLADEAFLWGPLRAAVGAAAAVLRSSRAGQADLPPTPTQLRAALWAAAAALGPEAGLGTVVSAWVYPAGRRLSRMVEARRTQRSRRLLRGAVLLPAASLAPTSQCDLPALGWCDAAAGTSSRLPGAVCVAGAAVGLCLSGAPRGLSFDALASGQAGGAIALVRVQLVVDRLCPAALRRGAAAGERRACLASCAGTMS